MPPRGDGFHSLPRDREPGIEPDRTGSAMADLTVDGLLASLSGSARRREKGNEIRRRVQELHQSLESAAVALLRFVHSLSVDAGAGAEHDISREELFAITQRCTAVCQACVCPPPAGPAAVVMPAPPSRNDGVTNEEGGHRVAKPRAQGQPADNIQFSHVLTVPWNKVLDPTTRAAYSQRGFQAFLNSGNNHEAGAMCAAMVHELTRSDGDHCAFAKVFTVAGVGPFRMSLTNWPASNGRRTRTFRPKCTDHTSKASNLVVCVRFDPGSDDREASWRVEYCFLPRHREDYQSGAVVPSTAVVTEGAMGEHQLTHFCSAPGESARGALHSGLGDGWLGGGCGEGEGTGADCSNLSPGNASGLDANSCAPGGVAGGEPCGGCRDGRETDGAGGQGVGADGSDLPMGTDGCAYASTCVRASGHAADAAASSREHAPPNAETQTPFVVLGAFGTDVHAHGPALTGGLSKRARTLTSPTTTVARLQSCVSTERWHSIPLCPSLSLALPPCHPLIPMVLCWLRPLARMLIHVQDFLCSLPRAQLAAPLINESVACAERVQPPRELQRPLRPRKCQRTRVQLTATLLDSNMLRWNPHAGADLSKLRALECG